MHLLGADCSLQTRFVIEVWPFDECWTDGWALLTLCSESLTEQPDD